MAEPGGPSERALQEATGRGWDAWLEVLDRAGAQDMDHAGIVAHLAAAHPEVSAWWAQSITVGYERARGRRAVGEAKGGFQLGVTRTVDAAPDAVWALLIGRPGLWLGEGALPLERGAAYRVEGALGAVRGEVRVVKPGDRIRMTWHPEGWAAPATLQVALATAKSGRTTVGFHLEQLPDAARRAAMKEHWTVVADRVVAALG
jgi:uncharacterized protein YndB with AHSA1/START domain